MTFSLSVLAGSAIVLATAVVAWKLKPSIDKMIAKKSKEETEALSVFSSDTTTNSEHKIQVSETEQSFQVSMDNPRPVEKIEVETPAVEAVENATDYDEGVELAEGITEEDAERIQENLMKDEHSAPKRKPKHKKRN